MKILLATPYLTYSWNTGSFILKALGELGHHTVLWDYRVTADPPSEDYDVALVQKGESIDPEKLKHPRINWYPDRLSRNPEFHDALKKYDKVFCWNKPEYSWAEFLPLGYDPDVHRDLGLERKLGCIYIGTANSKRKVEWVTAIKPQLIAGSNWENYGIKAYAPMHIPDFIRLMNMSKIVVNVHESDWGVNDKTFMIPQCSFMLVDDVPGVRKVFGDELANKISFSDPKEARELMAYYLGNPSELMKVWCEEKEKIKRFTCLNQTKEILGL